MFLTCVCMKDVNVKLINDSKIFEKMSKWHFEVRKSLNLNFIAKKRFKNHLKTLIVSRAN